MCTGVGNDYGHNIPKTIQTRITDAPAQDVQTLESLSAEWMRCFAPLPLDLTPVLVHCQNSIIDWSSGFDPLTGKLWELPVFRKRPATRLNLKTLTPASVPEQTSCQLTPVCWFVFFFSSTQESRSSRSTKPEDHLSKETFCIVGVDDLILTLTAPSVLRWALLWAGSAWQCTKRWSHMCLCHMDRKEWSRGLAEQTVTPATLVWEAWGWGGGRGYWLIYTLKRISSSECE